MNPQIKRQILWLIIIWGGFFALNIVWAWTNPSLSPPGGSGAITADSAGNVGIGTAAPAAKLDVAGTSIFRGVMNLTGNLISGVADPAAATDAANKNYVDSKITRGASTAKVWGEGRPSADVLKPNGECTKTVGGVTLKVSRSKRSVAWGGTAAVCPAGWWVCTSAERVAGTSCNTDPGGSLQTIRCDAQASTDEWFSPNNSSVAWVADMDNLGDPEDAVAINNGGTTVTHDSCSLYPAWCCTDQ